LSSITQDNLNGGTSIGPGPKTCTINYAIIKNGTIGIELDTVYNPATLTLQLDNTIIENESNTALLAKGSSIRCTNSLFANCGQYVAALTIGGDYNFRHCTFADYWNQGSGVRQTLLYI